MSDRGVYVTFEAEVQAKVLYQGMLSRLLDDVATPMQFYKRTGHGNWASLRMMAPVIEALADNDAESRSSILRQLGVEYPSVFWTMYRNGLMHNDGAPQSIQLDGKSIGWGFNWNQNEAAIMVGHNYSLNPSVILDNLVHWLRVQLADVSALEGKVIKEVSVVKVKADVDSELKTELTQILEDT